MDNLTSLTPVIYAQVGIASAAFHHARSTRLAYADVVTRIERAIEASGLWVLSKVDAQAFVQQSGFGLLGTVQILAFHPKFMVRLLEADPGALLQAPLKFAVLETPGGSVTVTWADHKAAFARYNNKALKEMGQELAVLCELIVNEALGK